MNEKMSDVAPPAECGASSGFATAHPPASAPSADDLIQAAVEFLTKPGLFKQTVYTPSPKRVDRNDLAAMLQTLGPLSVGWLYHCPDEGRQWAEQHPIASGENPYAQDIRPGTATNLLEELRDAWEVNGQLRNPDPATPEGTERSDGSSAPLHLKSQPTDGESR